MDNTGIESRREQDTYISSKSSRPALRTTRLSIQQAPAVVHLGVKRGRSEDYQWPVNSAEVKGGAIPHTLYIPSWNVLRPYDITIIFTET